jgi:hypothetical protein
MPEGRGFGSNGNGQPGIGQVTRGGLSMGVAGRAPKVVPMVMCVTGGRGWARRAAWLSAGSEIHVGEWRQLEQGTTARGGDWGEGFLTGGPWKREQRLTGGLTLDAPSTQQ